MKTNETSTTKNASFCEFTPKFCSNCYEFFFISFIHSRHRHCLTILHELFWRRGEQNDYLSFIIDSRETIRERDKNDAWFVEIRNRLRMHLCGGTIISLQPCEVWVAEVATKTKGAITNYECVQQPPHRNQRSMLSDKGSVTHKLIKHYSILKKRSQNPFLTLCHFNYKIMNFIFVSSRKGRGSLCYQLQHSMQTQQQNFMSIRSSPKSRFIPFTSNLLTISNWSCCNQSPPFHLLTL